MKQPFVIPHKLILITGHRRENFGQGFQNIFEAINELAQKHPEVDFVYTMHPKPNVHNAITNEFGHQVIVNEAKQSVKYTTNTHFIEPLDDLPFVHLMSYSFMILTDSGGIQEEAPGLGKPVLVMRDTTERLEALEAKTVKLVGTDKDIIIREVSILLNHTNLHETMLKANNPYGNELSIP